MSLLKRKVIMEVCSNCFDDLELKEFVITNSKKKGQCDFCISTNEPTALVPLAELLDFFTGFLEIFEEDKSSGIPLNKILLDEWNVFNPDANINGLLEAIISNSKSIKLKSFKDKVAYLNEITECTSYWETLKKELKWNRRFLTNVDNIFDLGWDSFFDTKSDLAMDQIFYRARIHKKDGQKGYEKDKMGCPPKTSTTNGRANPEGIPFLYLSRDLHTTFYETRVTFLDEVSVGSFKTITGKKIVVDDFTNEGSPFLNMNNMLNYTKSRLLKKAISKDLSKPIRRYDSQLEYIPTQFICEFIRYVTGSDGIVFNSSLHKGGVNYVLFDESKLECIKVEKHHVTAVDIMTKKD